MFREGEQEWTHPIHIPIPRGGSGLQKHFRRIEKIAFLPRLSVMPDILSCGTFPTRDCFALDFPFGYSIIFVREMLAGNRQT